MACITVTVLWKASAFRALRPLSLASSRSFSKRQQAPAAQNFSGYESIQEQYKPEVPEYFNFAKDVVDKWAEAEKEGRRPTSPALWWVSEQGEQVKWTFAELALVAKKAAWVLSEQCGLRKGDRVIVILPRIPEWWLLNVACMRTGTVLIPGTTQLTATDILHRIQTSKARCIITDQALAPAVDAVASKCPSLEFKLIVSRDPREGWRNFNDLLEHAPAEDTCVATKSHDPLAIYFTSGTTGTPKMTEHSHASHGIGLDLNGRYWLDLTPLDIIWNTSDTGWAKSAWSSIFAPWSQGACVFVHGMPRFEPQPVLETLSRFPITTFCSAPTAYRMLIHHNLTSYKFHSLKHCVSAGEPMNPEVMEQWKTETGLDIYEGYGQTETVLICGTFKGMKIKPGSMGKPSPAYDTQIIDEDCNILSPGKEGDIAIRIKAARPFCLFTQYTDDPERTASSVRGDFYITGDRGMRDEDGYLWFVGRADDVINSAGYRIGPFEVESALIEHPAVVESAVVSSPDSIRGEVVKAFVVLSPDYVLHDPEALIKELQDHVKKVTAPYKYPRKVEFVPHLPKTVSGKIRRNELRKKEWGKA
ncbi:acyl-coenzyme A synthetase ACSM3, mitochondrial-like isoform X1 [Rhineura floridana]|uniref:acyl-coenzyme A synthetase ACSM3, mitochondrial-like isoform X1 n=1 Tax=Rhineura floridana TaxID=261503 RepID=UPI002AC83687|nr:acyl-coenzyme A synthetase ACSM3, mitochondrial-like isoform X1 [Rhineura floridana]XP_061456362.1 acyl-coenzyme A synthetase ACSM3, mitochondrial-like isoform X1 [Rhineura floridana]XP_061456363.1 acyl-coenzyme A synthetase ACSM3, mitochondrial-like isoform X1 [Rhineura floridana]XP_061456364.1 acyl-coenzyme A synthetase ACSM3, mitochondrial-like isoform X1 [Rhineura floridana]XP_061456365.1 acyl-coenzyme A synthetase ACSM3, mitochondrial-like isoform X1 [Rhineura floridana]XP_061456366.1 